MRYLVTDWDELHEVLADVPHQWRTTCPLPVPGDAWVVEASFAEAETLREAVRTGVDVLVVGSPGQLDPAIRTIQGIEWQVGDELIRMQSSPGCARTGRQRHRDRDSKAAERRRGSSRSLPGCCRPAAGWGRNIDPQYRRVAGKTQGRHGGCRSRPVWDAGVETSGRVV